MDIRLNRNDQADWLNGIIGYDYYEFFGAGQIPGTAVNCPQKTDPEEMIGFRENGGKPSGKIRYIIPELWYLDYN